MFEDYTIEELEAAYIKRLKEEHKGDLKPIIEILQRIFEDISECIHEDQQA